MSVQAYSDPKEKLRLTLQSNNSVVNIVETDWSPNIQVTKITLDPEQVNIAVSIESQNDFFDTSVQLVGQEVRNLNIVPKPLWGFQMMYGVQNKLQKFEFSHEMFTNWKILYSESFFLGKSEEKIELNYRFQF